MEPQRHGVREAPPPPPTPPTCCLGKAWDAPTHHHQLKAVRPARFLLRSWAGWVGAVQAVRRAPRADEGKAGDVVGRCLSASPAKRSEFGRRPAGRGRRGKQHAVPALPPPTPHNVTKARPPPPSAVKPACRGSACTSCHYHKDKARCVRLAQQLHPWACPVRAVYQAPDLPRSVRHRNRNGDR